MTLHSICDENGLHPWHGKLHDRSIRSLLMHCEGIPLDKDPRTTQLSTVIEVD
jgi:hypothetical protein